VSIGPIDSPFVVTVAGGLHPSYIDGTGIEARFNEPTALAFGPAGDLFVGEAASGRLRRLDADGKVSTYGLLGGERPDDQPDMALLRAEVALAGLDDRSEDSEDHAEPEPERPRDHLSWFKCEGLAVSREGTIVIADALDGRLWLATRDGLAQWFSGRTYPTIDVARDGTITLLDFDGPRQFRSFPEARLAQQWRDGPSHASRFAHPQGMAYLPDGDLVVADGDNGRLRRVRPDGSTESLPPVFEAPSGVAVGPEGQLYVSDAKAHTIHVVLPSGQTYLLAGSVGGFQDGQGGGARFFQPRGLAVDDAGGIWVADSGNHAIRHISSDGVVVTVAGRGEAGSQDGPAEQAAFNRPWGVVGHPSGGVLVADRDNHRIRWVMPGGRVTLPVGEDGLLYAEEVAQGRTLDRQAPPRRLWKWKQIVGQEIRAVVKDYGHGRVRIYFPGSFIEVEGRGRWPQADLMPYFKPTDGSDDFYFLPFAFVGRTIASAHLDRTSDESSLHLVFSDGSDVLLETYMSGTLKVIKTDADAPLEAGDLV
jgi:DNA-binding beta-propeller fold protein YncE